MLPVERWTGTGTYGADFAHDEKSTGVKLTGKRREIIMEDLGTRRASMKLYHRQTCRLLLLYLKRR